MKINFNFKTDEQSYEFCLMILNKMIELFKISREEALGRMNRTWNELEFIDADIIYHEDEEYWANNIYYGKDSLWWTNPANLKPLPYP